MFAWAELMPFLAQSLPMCLLQDQLQVAHRLHKLSLALVQVAGRQRLPDNIDHL